MSKDTLESSEIEEKKELHRLPKSLSSTSSDSRYNPLPPFLVRKSKEKALFNSRQFEQFINLIRKVNANVSFYDLLTSIPKYAKFVKNLILNKNKVRE